MKFPGRENYVGASDCATILGVGRYGSRVQLWLEKTGKQPHVELESSILEAGNRLEGPIADWWAETAGVTVEEDERELIHPEYDFIRGHIDRRVVEWPDRLLEVKNVNQFAAHEWGESGTDDVPIHYRIQVMVYMALTGCVAADVVALVGGNDLRHLVVHRDDDLIAKIIQGVADWWQECVVEGNPPEPESPDDCRLLWPRSNGERVTCDDAGVLEAWELYRVAHDRMKAAEKQKEDARVAMEIAMGEAETLHSEQFGQVLCTAKTSSRTAFDLTAFREANPVLAEQFMKKTETRTFRIRQPKKQKVTQ